MVLGDQTGVSAMAETWGDFMSTWKDLRVQADEYREPDPERALVLAQFSGRGRASGLR